MIRDLFRFVAHMLAAVSTPQYVFIRPKRSYVAELWWCALFCVHFQPLRLAYPDATNIEAGAHSVWPATGPAAAAGLLHDIAVGKCFLQFSDTLVSDVGAVKTEAPQLRQLHYVYKPRVGNLGALEPKRRQLGQRLEMYQPRVGGFGAAEEEHL